LENPEIEVEGPASPICLVCLNIVKQLMAQILNKPTVPVPSFTKLIQCQETSIWRSV
jgi:hypothetical protein